MVLVAAIALGGSTFAWFANNNKVSATGMNVQAKAEGGIEIKVKSATQSLATGYTNTWATAADTKIGAENPILLYPTSNLASSASDGVITSNWYHASAAIAGAFGAKSDTYCTLQSVASKCTFTNGVASGNGVLTYEDGVSGFVSAGTYYLAATYQIARTGSGAQDLKVSGVTVTGTTDGGKNFDKSLRVAIACGTNVVLYAPVGYTGVSTAYKVATAAPGPPMELNTATMPAENNVTALTSTQTSSVLAAAIGDEDAPTEVNVYIWYEGEDTNLYTDGAETIDGLSVTVDFVATV
jgi:hypothetical protein